MVASRPLSLIRRWVRLLLAVLRPEPIFRQGDFFPDSNGSSGHLVG
jgi:hypothetical protein